MTVPVKPQMTYDDFQKIDVRVGTIISCENVPKSDKLLKLQVDFGDLGQRQILTGMAKFYKPEQLVGLKTTFVVNLPPRNMMGEESNGMVFALGLSDETTPTFLKPLTDVENGEGAR